MEPTVKSPSSRNECLKAALRDLLKAGYQAADTLLDNQYLHKETKKVLKELQEINRLGLITLNSQDGVIKKSDKVPVDQKLYIESYPQSDEELSDNEAKRVRKRNYIKKGGAFVPGIKKTSRAYIQGVTHELIAFYLVNRINRTSIVAYTGCQDCDQYTVIPVTYQFSDISDNAVLKPGEPPKTTHLPICAYNEAEETIPDYVKDVVVPVHLLDPVHGRNQEFLLKHTITALNEVHEILKRQGLL